MAGSAALAVAWRSIEQRRLSEAVRILRGLVRPWEPDPADRALRALSLVGSDGEVRSEGTSQELARLHVARAIAAIRSDGIVERGARAAARLRVLAFIGAACAFGIVAARAWSVLEGADVLVARGHLAPVTMQWLNALDVSARPPDYVHDSERHALAFASLLLPSGTVVTVRGAPVHAGRQLLLSDGTTEVPFVDDGAGGVVARWTLTQSTSLHVVARFGEVAIPESDALVVESLPDRQPTVVLEGAPRQIRIVDQSDDDVPIRYEATDDHGLREVHLVLRSGVREERRVLARLDGDTKSDKGGSLLKLRDPFLRKSHAPIEVTVEAKDNDPLTGPKWGASAPLTLIPADIGETEARRLDALRTLRDALVDSLAWRLSNSPPDEANARKSFIAAESTRAAADDALVEHTLTEGYAGVRLPPRIRSPLVFERRAMEKALVIERSRLSAAAHEGVIQVTEHFVLIVDAVLRGLGVHDARDAARQLADVADDLALGALQAHGVTAEASSRSVARMNAATTVLSGGASVMKRLGTLGRDLGEIVSADLLRVTRARDASDLAHAELAARDLATRLREPDPSFGARGGRIARAGGESGGAHDSPMDEANSPDDVDQVFQQAAKDVEQLAQDHAGEIAKMEQALSAATSEEEIEQLRQDAKRHAEAIREASRALPGVGSGSDSWTSKGAAARELAEQMARSLEKAKGEDAVQSGRGALGALDEAKRMLQRESWLEDPSGQQRLRVEEVRRKLDAEEKWVEQKLEEMQKRAVERARRDLEAGGEEEGKLADRARELAHRGRERGPLPQEAVESIDDAQRAARQAAEALRRGEAETGLRHQHEAQRHLEAANDLLQGDEQAKDSTPSGPAGGNARSTPSGTDVPSASKHKGPEEFRKRVVRGLGQPASGGLKDAVRRYAEGLLR